MNETEWGSHRMQTVTDQNGRIGLGLLEAKPSSCPYCRDSVHPAGPLRECSRSDKVQQGHDF